MVTWLGANLERTARLAGALRTYPRIMIAAPAIGALPFLVCYLLQTPGHQFVTAVLLWPLFLACLYDGSVLKPFVAIAATFFVHSAFVILFSSLDPGAVSNVVPDGADYWNKQIQWIRTGVDPEYDVSTWIPAHAQLLAAVLILSFTSLGLMVFYHGLFEVDLMNYYTGQLLAHSKSGPTALLLGWHAWSLCRGIGYMLIVYLVSVWVFSKLTRQPLPKRLWIGWCAALAFVVLDGVLKFVLLDTVRTGLLANLE